MRVPKIVTVVFAGILLGACASLPPGPGYVSVSAGTAACNARPCAPAYPYSHPYTYPGPGIYGPPYYYGPTYYGPPVYRGRAGRFRGFR